MSAMTGAPRHRLLHLISGLGVGGANLMLYKLLAHRDTDRFDVSVVSLADRGGGVDRQIAALGVPVRTVGMFPRPTPTTLARLLAWVRELEPELIQGWMYHGNVAAWLGAALLRPAPIVLWNVRHSLHDLAHERLNTRLMIRAGAVLSSRARRILYNSEVAARQHERLGYDGQRRLVLPNGFDCDRFRPSAAARTAIRRELGLASDAPLIGIVARDHPMKDHRTFLLAAAMLARQRADVHFVLAGDGVDPSNRRLGQLAVELGVGARVHLLGIRTDVEVVTAALDVATSCSRWGEAFANVIGEAMACGVPMVVTDVGDSAHIVGDLGTVVPLSDPPALAAAWSALLALTPALRARLGEAARARVVGEYSLESVVGRYEGLYADLLSRSVS